MKVSAKNNLYVIDAFVELSKKILEDRLQGKGKSSRVDRFEGSRGKGGEKDSQGLFDRCCKPMGNCFIF